MRYTITLRSGVRLDGDDERSVVDLLEATAEVVQTNNLSGDNLPLGWVWLADHYLLASEIVGIELLESA